MPPASSTTSGRLLLAVVIFLGALIVIALALLGYGVATHIGRRGAPASDQGPAMFALPAKSQILEMQNQPGRVILHVRTPEGDEVLILDTETGRVVGRVKAAK